MADEKIDFGDEIKDDKVDENKTPVLKDEGKDDTKVDGSEKDKADKLGDDETPEEKAEREAAEAAEEAKRRIRIPKARFDEAQEKARKREDALQAQIKELQKAVVGTQTKTETSELQKKLNEAKDKYEDLLLDGKGPEARAVRKEIDALQDTLIEQKTSLKSDQARKAAVEELEYNSSLARLESLYPSMNPDNKDEFDQDQVDEILVLFESFTARGFTRKTALEKSVKYVLGEPKSADKGSKDEAEVIKQKRAEEARKKAAEANKKQPGDTTKVGEDSDKHGDKGGKGIDVMRISQKDFAKLDDATLAALRGDEVA